MRSQATRDQPEVRTEIVQSSSEGNNAARNLALPIAVTTLSQPNRAHRAMNRQMVDHPGAYALTASQMINVAATHSGATM